MIVVGYNKGPCQVSLITVREDQVRDALGGLAFKRMALRTFLQRPSRIDLSHKAHSTVIENRALGKSYPNPGIACLAPVARDTFLSGGHDKTVHRWTIARSSRNGDRGGFSARSVRIPTDHTHSVQALAYCAWSNMVYSAAGDRISTTKLAALAHTEPERVSGKVTQVHVHPQDPRLIALEVGSRLRRVNNGSMSAHHFHYRSTIWTIRCTFMTCVKGASNIDLGSSLVIVPPFRRRAAQVQTARDPQATP